jgi:hypothetical protein
VAEGCPIQATLLCKLIDPHGGNVAAQTLQEFQRSSRGRVLDGRCDEVRSAIEQAQSGEGDTLDCQIARFAPAASEDSVLQPGAD